MAFGSEGQSARRPSRCSDSEPPLFRGEKRTWAIELTTREGDAAWEYSYRVPPAKQNDLWIYRPRLRRIERISHGPLENVNPTLRLCHALATSGLAEEVQILQRTTGWAKASGELRRAIDPGRMTKCR